MSERASVVTSFDFSRKPSEYHVDVAGQYTALTEVVVPGETGLLVPIEQADDGTGTPLDPDRYVADFAEALNDLVADPARAASYGRAGRERAIESFGWTAIAERTREVYRSTQRD